jgi:hypothetical protein
VAQEAPAEKAPKNMALLFLELQTGDLFKLPVFFE